MGLSTDPAAAIHFEEDLEWTEKSGAARKKKTSLVDYFYVKAFTLLTILITVQSSSSTTWIALYHCPEEHIFADGGTFFIHPFVLLRYRFAMLLQDNASCANSMNDKRPHS